MKGIFTAISLRAPFGSLALGVSPPYAWGQEPGRLTVLNQRVETTYRGDLLVHQGQAAAPDLEMKFTPHDQDQFPRGYLLGLVTLYEVRAPGAPCADPWAEPGQWHWMLRFPRPFREPIRLSGERGLFTVSSRKISAAVEEAEYAARAGWRALPESDREEMMERAAIAEDGGLSCAAANQLALTEWIQKKGQARMGSSSTQEGSP